jgi:hypothetical protein
VTTSLNTINELVFIMEIQYVLCEMRAEFLCITYMDLLLQRMSISEHSN